MVKQSNAKMANIIYETVKEDIINNKYEGGTFLVESQLSVHFQVSRTPVREALIRLSQEGFIEMIPNKGAFIPHITINDIIELCILRAANEGMAAYLCAQNPSSELISLLNNSVDKETALLSNPDTNPAIISSEDMAFHRLIANGCNSPRLQEHLSIINNQMHRFMKASADKMASDTSLKKSLSYHKMIVKSISDGDSVAAQTAVTDHWFAMQNGYIQRNLIGKLDPTL